MFCTFAGYMKRILFGLLVLLGCLSVQGQQVVNIESKRYDSRDSALHGEIELLFNFIQNQNKIINLGSKLNLTRVRQENTVLFLAELNFLQSNSKNLDYNAYQHIRFKRELKPWLSGEAFAQTQFNQQIGLKFRGLLGAGPRIRIFYEDSMKLFVGPMWMYEYERTTDEYARNVHNRMSLYVSFLYFKSSAFNFDIVSYYQPDLIDFSNFRFSSEARLNLKFTTNFSFRISYSQNFQSHPPSGMPNNLSTLRNSFLYKF